MFTPRYPTRDTCLSRPVSFDIDPLRLADREDCAHYLDCLNRTARERTPKGYKPPSRVCADGCGRYASQGQ